MIPGGNTLIELMHVEDVPPWFRYPKAFVRTVETGIVQFHPWKILNRSFAMIRMAGLKERFPARDLVPFALRTDCDDVACWEQERLDRVVIIHDFAEPGWEDVAVFETFWQWFRSAIEDFITFEP